MTLAITPPGPLPRPDASAVKSYRWIPDSGNAPWPRKSAPTPPPPAGTLATPKTEPSGRPTSAHVAELPPEGREGGAPFTALRLVLLRRLGQASAIGLVTSLSVLFTITCFMKQQFKKTTDSQRLVHVI